MDGNQLKWKPTKKEELIMRKNKMTITILGCIGIFLITALMLVPTAQGAEKTVKYNYTTQLTKVEFVVLPDVPGHVAIVYERRGVAIFENEIASTSHWGTADFIKKQGSFMGYTLTTYADGSTTLVKVSGAKVFAPDGKLRVYKDMKGEFIKGTGRFEGIKGKVSATGKEITPYTKDKTKQDNWIEVTSTYTLPKK
jgi:hypothetical protein